MSEVISLFKSFILADFSLLESNRAVIGIPGDGRSGMSICIVVHVMKAACKYVEEFICIKSLRAGFQVFVLLMLFLCVILHNMWLDKSMQLLCILAFAILRLGAIRMMFEVLCCVVLSI